jgi:hypothetical protein
VQHIEDYIFRTKTCKSREYVGTFKGFNVFCMKRKQGNRCSTGHYYRYKYGNKKECHMIITGKNMGYNFSVGKRKSPREAWKKD